MKLDKVYDISNMDKAVASFSDQINESFSIFNKNLILKEYSKIDSIIILGMGGSAIGGDLVRVILSDNCRVPIFVNRSYVVPKWVSENTLVIASSYSGNTEETLDAFFECIKRKSKIVIISTGGRLVKLGKENRIDTILLPSGYQPRAALGYSFTIINLLLNHIGLINNKIIHLIRQSIGPLSILTSDLIKSNNIAIDIASKIYNTFPVLYGTSEFSDVVALRLRGQLAENAKILSFHNSFPEQNHNEIEGWTLNQDILARMSIIWFEDRDDHNRNKKRIAISKKLFNSYIKTEVTLFQEGENYIERLLKLIHLSDWISYYTAL